MNRKIFLTVLSLFIVMFFAGCNLFNVPPTVTDDEILLQIRLNIEEDIGLLVVDYDSDGSGGSGGASNADKSLLKHDDLIYFTIEKRSFDNPSDVKNLSLQFTVITEYCDPNYDNIYPAEYTMPLSAIRLDVNFGETYFITITGDKTNGYVAKAE